MCDNDNFDQNETSSTVDYIETEVDEDYGED
jgi:hypothetical protein